MPDRPEHDSVHEEPHNQPGPKRIDPSEQKADKTLGKEAESSKAIYKSGDSVYEEPDILPGRNMKVIDQDWSCSNCGYNLRGLEPGHLCPECGHREWYLPPPAGVESYKNWLEERIFATSPVKGWLIAFIAAFVGGLMAIITSMLGTEQSTLASFSMVIMAVVFAPTVEETMKIAATAFVIESRPYLFRRVEQIQVAAIGAALIFAAIENFMYLNIYITNPSYELVLHCACTLVASRGLIKVWNQTMTEHRPPKITQGLPMLITAIVMHGFYNLCATFAPKLF